ncbi:MAG: hypothetical protein HY361_01925 [Candidatus Aenigmarchaeota archaeon]|nr:hypothetical protein [Candidatus Aenigmarchaeota archaeon]
MRHLAALIVFSYLSFLIAVVYAQSTGTFVITGKVLDSTTGNPIASGNVTAIVKENGNRNTSEIVAGSYSVNLTSNLTDKKISIGIITNSTDGKIGYSSLVANLGGQATQDQKCSARRWRFNGTAVDSKSGTVISSGTVSISAKETDESNSTTFSNGAWDIYFSPCLISGDINTFQIKILDGSKVGEMFLRLVAK